MRISEDQSVSQSVLPQLVAVLPLLMGLTTEEVFLVQAIATLGQVVGPLLFSTFSDR